MAALQLKSPQNVINKGHHPQSADNAILQFLTFLLIFAELGVENESDQLNFLGVGFFLHCFYMSN